MAMASSDPAYGFLQDEAFAKAATEHGLDVAQIQTLAVAAVRAKARAYCTYSNFRVGAALLTKSSLPLSAVVNDAPHVGGPRVTDPSSSSSSSFFPSSSTHPSSAGGQQIIIGANIENCSYPVGTCAERAAFATAVSMGHLAALPPPPPSSSSSSDGPGIAAVAVSADTDEPCSPCGMCRQFMREFLPPHTPVFMVAREGGWAVKTMGDLLPMSFGASDLKGGQGRG